MAAEFHAEMIFSLLQSQTSTPNAILIMGKNNNTESTLTSSSSGICGPSFKCYDPTLNVLNSTILKTFFIHFEQGINVFFDEDHHPFLAIEFGSVTAFGVRTL